MRPGPAGAKYRSPIAGESPPGKAIVSWQRSPDTAAEQTPALRQLFCGGFSRMPNAGQQKRLLRRQKTRASFSCLWSGNTEKNSAIHAAFAFAAARNNFLPFGVRRTNDARRLCGSAARSTKPSASNSSVRPVMLPVVTIRRLEISPMRRPAFVESNCAIRSKRERLMSKEARSRRRASLFISLWTAIMRSQSRKSSLSVNAARVSRSSSGSLNAALSSRKIHRCSFDNCRGRPSASATASRPRLQRRSRAGASLVRRRESAGCRSDWWQIRIAD